MTNEEAIKTLRALRDMTGGLCREAVEVAIDAIEERNEVAKEMCDQCVCYLNPEMGKLACAGCKWGEKQ